MVLAYKIMIIHHHQHLECTFLRFNAQLVILELAIAFSVCPFLLYSKHFFCKYFFNVTQDLMRCCRNCFWLLLLYAHFNSCCTEENALMERLPELLWVLSPTPSNK